MKRWLIFLAACSSPGNPHTVVACQGYLTQAGTPFTGNCEVACQKAGSNGGSPVGTGGACTGAHGSGFGQTTVDCAHTLDYQDNNGCCAPGTDGVADVEFYVCM
jgi:hypothetical protein